MLFRSLVSIKGLSFSLAMSCCLWLAGHAVAQQAHDSSMDRLSPEEEFALIQSCDAPEVSNDTTLKQRCEARQASMATIMKSTLNRWIELESNKSNQRIYVAIPERAEQYSVTKQRIHLRYDAESNANKDTGTAQRLYPPTVVRTLDLNCKDGETTLLTMHIYDKDGKPEFSKDVEQPKAERILHFYQSPLRLVCTKEYLIPFLRNGEQLIAMQKAEDARKSKALVPDRVVAVPK